MTIIYVLLYINNTRMTLSVNMHLLKYYKISETQLFHHTIIQLT